MNKLNRFLVIGIIFFLASFSQGQFRGSMQSSFQIGNLPGESPGNRSNLYNQINLQYNQDHFTLGLRAENYFVDDENEYKKITQKYVRFQDGNLQITAGNFYEILGRGVLLRGYEIPGAIYEDGSTRQRYGFYKDVEGLSMRYSNDYFGLKFLYGRPLNNIVPFAFGEKARRDILIQGGELAVNYFTFLQPGVIYLRSDQQNDIHEYGGFFVQGFTMNGLQYHLEFSQNLAAEYNLLQTSDNPYGFYGSLSYGLDFVNATFEYKDYNRYALIFNDPPSLVREHSFTLLNRSTHSIEPGNESGYQAELLFNIGDLNTVTVNHSAAQNSFGDIDYDFFEYYADINYYINEDWLAKAFADYAQDELISEKNRYTVGVSSEDFIYKLWSYSTELQYQMFDREYLFAPDQNHDVENILFLLSINNAPAFSFTFSFEQAKDPVETNTLVMGDRSKTKSWLGYTINYQYNQNHSLSLFAGERRGGNACAGGICYQVQPFKGIELRLNSRF